MSTKLNFGRDVQGMNAYAPYFAKDLYSAELDASTPTTLTVPSNFKTWIAVFTYTSAEDVWVSDGGTAAVPAGATFATTTSVLRPAARLVTAGDVLSFITAASDVNVGVEFYAISSDVSI